jgi:glutathione synthase/RimK-type ligase-like ATP-grasp enzyme
MTKILLISNKDDITTDFIVQRLHERKISFYRLNTEEITKSISISFDISANSFLLFDKALSKEIDLTQFTGVYFRRPELPMAAQDLSVDERDFVLNEISGLLEGIYQILRTAVWVSNVYSIRKAENKIYQLILAKSLGFKIPLSLISNSFDETARFVLQRDNCIVKPIRTGWIKGEDDKIVFTTRLDSFPENREQIESCPQFFQAEIKKNVDLRVTIVGNKAFCAAIHSQDDPQTVTDWRKSEALLRHSEHRLPQYIEQLCIRLVCDLKLNFGAIDLVLDQEGNYYFLEINPNGQWAWIEKQLRFDISGELVKLLCNETSD